jgi:hypothetical protein
MSGMRRIGTASCLLLVLLAAERAEALEGYCTSGAVNTITGNYVGETLTAQAARDGEEGLTDRCEICLVVRVQEAGAPGGWGEVGRVCNIWTDARAHDVMFRIGQCGLIVSGGFEQGAVYYGSAVPIRIEAVRLPPCR